jgi:hypothetical protein
MPFSGAAEKREIVFDYQVGPIAQAFHSDVTSRVKCLLGPFGTGKTTNGACDLILAASGRVMLTQGKLRSRFAVVRNTYPQLKDTTMRTYFDWFPDGIWGRYNATDKIFKIVRDQAGTQVEVELLFKALDSPEDVRDLLSLELTGAHIDEAREIPHDVFKGILGRVGRFPSLKDTGGKDPFLNPPQVVLTSNYPSTEHWLYEDFVAHPVQGYTLYRQTQEENKHNLRPNYYEDLERDFANRPDLLTTLVRGNWGVTVRGRQVYPEFDHEFHVAKSAIQPLDAPVIRGWDNTGLSPACVITQLGPTGQWLILKEFTADDMGIVDMGEMVQIWCADTFGKYTGKYRDIGDPAGRVRDTGKMSPKDYLAKIGIYVEDGQTHFKVRREAVAGRLTKRINKQPAILIDPGCKRLVDGFMGGYAYPEIGNSGVFRPEPQKNDYSHIHDSLQYPATRLFIHESDDTEKPLRTMDLACV